jgi:hypothetical protein
MTKLQPTDLAWRTTISGPTTTLWTPNSTLWQLLTGIPYYMASEMTFESGWRDLTSSKPIVCKRKGVIQVSSCFSSLDDRGYRPNANPPRDLIHFVKTPLPSSSEHQVVRILMCALPSMTERLRLPSAPSPALPPLLSATAKI